MLGGLEATPSSTFASASAHSSFPSDEKRRLRGTGKGFLFGDEEDTRSPVRERKMGGVVASAGAGAGAGAGRGKAREAVEVIDLGEMGRGGAVG